MGTGKGRDGSEEHISSPDTVTSTLPPTSPPPGPSANLSAVQADSLRKDIDTQSARQAALGAEASALEGSIATDASSLSELEARLKTARASSDAKQARVASLRERASAQSDELASLRAELISVESALSALKMEWDEVEQSLMKEREDVLPKRLLGFQAPKWTEGSASAVRNSLQTWPPVDMRGMYQTGAEGCA
ncbi:hypothetical protein A4X06_0g4012 [Tilletia controversa]|uniref:Uncharacterized protein n=1 Tax=Tilletia controversa TaxID=13291 RepID=A0A8X7MTD8_9BASI|nr:hypothetical protein A4X06_0g4012 [Tilletia controversa]